METVDASVRLLESDKVNQFFPENMRNWLVSFHRCCRYERRICRTQDTGLELCVHPPKQAAELPQIAGAGLLEMLEVRMDINRWV